MGCENSRRCKFYEYLSTVLEMALSQFLPSPSTPKKIFTKVEVVWSPKNLCDNPLQRFLSLWQYSWMLQAVTKQETFG